MHDLEQQSDGSWFCRKCGSVFSPATSAQTLGKYPCYDTATPRLQTHMAQIRAGHQLIKQWMDEKGYTE